MTTMRPHAPARRALALLLLAALGLRAAAQAPGYDPSRDQDPDTGRIPRGNRPDELPNPERWRYMPEMRLVEGDILERFLVTTFISPIVFREEDIGFGGGLAFTDINFRNQRFREFANAVVSYSEEGQQAYRMTWRRWLHHREVPGGGVLRDERSTLTLRGGYTKTLTRRFFGFGSRTRELDETSYTDEVVDVGFDVQESYPRPGDDLILTAGLSYAHHGLSRGRVSTLPSADVAFPTVFADGDDHHALWLRAGIAYDTRDSLHQPYRGGRVGTAILAAPLQSDGDVGAVFGIDASYTVPLPSLFHNGADGDEENPPTDVLVLGGFVNASTGELPFYERPSLGGDRTLRGFIQNRFTDDVAAHGTLEYRFVIGPRGVRISDTIRIERFTLGLFYDFGTVAHDVDSLVDGRFLDSYGAGLRIGFNRDAVFRIDLGFSDEDTNLTLAFGHSF